MASRKTGWAAVVALLVAAGPWPAWHASAGCVAPYLEDSATGAAPPVLVRGSTVTIEGDAFATGCDDTGPTWGCSGESRVPMRDVTLRIRQGEREWELGAADASDGDEVGHVEWTVALPDGLEPGRATLRADQGDPLRVRVR
jgi:hypothetical protein